MASKSKSLEFLAHQFTLLHAAASRNPNANIPSCEEWSSTDLVIHLDRVYRFVIAALAGNHETRPGPLPEGTNPFLSLKENSQVLFTALEQQSEDAAIWNWKGDDNPNWWTRRMCHETLIHRVDAELGAAGRVSPIDSTWASDGLDEVFSNFFTAPRLVWKSKAGSVVHVHSTDATGEWLLTHSGEDVALTREHAKGDIAIKGPAEHLLLYIYGRGDDDELEIFGDQELKRTFQKLCI